MDDQSRIWRGDIGRRLPTEGCHSGDTIGTTAFSPDGTRIVTANGRTCVWNAATGAEIARTDDLGIESARFSPDGRSLVTTSRDGTVAIWDAGSGQRQQILKRADARIASASFSPDGARVLTAAGTTAQLWDAATGAALQLRLTHEVPLVHAAFSTDSTRILTVTEDKKVHVWDGKTGQHIDALSHDHAVSHAAFSPDGRYVAAATQGPQSFNNTAVVWNLATRMQVAVLAHEEGVNAVAFSPNGSRLATVSRTVGVWDFARRVAVASIASHSGAPLLSMDFNPGGTGMVVATDVFVTLWPYFDDIQDLVDHAKNAIARCLTQGERSFFQLEAPPPRWSSRVLAASARRIPPGGPARGRTTTSLGASGSLHATARTIHRCRRIDDDVRDLGHKPPPVRRHQRAETDAARSPFAADRIRES